MNWILQRHVRQLRLMASAAMIATHCAPARNSGQRLLKHRLGSSIALILPLFASSVSTVRAEVIYSQLTPTPPIGAFSSNDQGNPTDQKVADNFFVSGPGPATIRSLRFIGGYGLTNPPPQTPPLNALPSDDFRVVLFNDSAGSPGLPLAGGDFYVGVHVSRTATGGPLLNGVYTPFEYAVDLGTGINVNTATVYWLSIVNNVGPNYGWVWARAVGVFDQRVASTEGDVLSGPWQVFRNEDGMYFALSDNNVPEPDSLEILMAAACGVWQLRLRRGCISLLRARSAK